MTKNELIAENKWLRERAALWKRCAKLRGVGYKAMLEYNRELRHFHCQRANKAEDELDLLKKDARELATIADTRVIRDASGNLCNRGNRELFLIYRILEATKED